MARARKSKAVTLTGEECDIALQELIEEASVALLMSVPGVAEALSEAWNNGIIARAIRNRER